MNKLNYTAPAIEVIELELEGVIAVSFGSTDDMSEPTSAKGSSSIDLNSYSMDNYNWK